MNYIIFGGTFDPIHNGHLRIASFAAKKFSAKVIFVPNKSPRWKEPLTDISHRSKMLFLALKEADFKFEISTFEVDKEDEINYSIDTVRNFKEVYPNDELYFLIGADQVNQFDKWKDAVELSKLAKIIFSNRPNFELSKENIEKFNMTSLDFYDSGDVSSSDIRELKSLDLPNSVREYIEDNGLYYIGKIAKYVTPQRLAHSIQVARLSYKIAKVNKLENPEHYYIAAILHDVGKTSKCDKEDAVEFMKEHYPEYIDLPKFAYHQFIGEYLAKTEFGIEDKEILDAIKFHCTGNANMSKLAMVVYASDKIEPTRQFDSTWLINSCLKDYYQGFIDTLVDNKKYLLGHAKDITNKLTDACFKEYIGE